jgi:hypothetical protein
VTGSSSECFCWRDVGDRFGSGQFSLERCGQQIRVGSDFFQSMWATGSCWDGFCWRDVGDRLELGGFFLERCGLQV